MQGKSDNEYSLEMIKEIKKFIYLSEEEKFSDMVFEYLMHENLKNSQFYNRCLIDRRTFAKFSKENYQPSKNTVICVCIGLELDLIQTSRLLNIAGFSLSPVIPFDRAIIFFITNKIYDINLINKYLNDLSLELLGYMKKIKI